MAFSWLQAATQQAYAPKQSVLDILKANMAGYRPARDDGVVHASDITQPTFCARQLALLAITKEKKKGQYLGTALQATFDVGDVTSDLFREKWAGSAAHGFWQCRRCDWVAPFGPKPKTGCKHGGSCSFKYIEARFLSKTYQVSGSIDVFLDLNAPKLFVTELKIMTPDDFEKLAAPLAEHRIRTNLYLKIIDDDGGTLRDRIHLKEAKVVYVSRGHGKKNPDFNNEIIPFKEYTVTRDDESLEIYLKKAIEVKQFKEQGTIPAGLCSTALDKAAKKCQVCHACFSGEYPAGATYKAVSEHG